MKFAVTVAGQSFQIEVDHDHLVWVDGRPLYVDLEQVGGLPVYSLAVEEMGYFLFVEKGLEGYLVEVQGQTYPVEVELQRPRLGRERVDCAGDSEECYAVSAPLAGRLTSLPVAAGDRIAAGQVVAVVESMKMQMEIRASEAGVVEAVCGPPGRGVAQGDRLVTLRPE